MKQNNVWSEFTGHTSLSKKGADTLTVGSKVKGSYFSGNARLGITQKARLLPRWEKENPSWIRLPLN